MKFQQALVSLFLFFESYLVEAFQVTKNFSADFMSSGALQCQDDNLSSTLCRGGLVLQPQLSYTPIENTTLSATLGFASGNALNNITPFLLQPWNADLEDVVRHINGRNRSFILTAYSSHEIQFNPKNSLAITAGIIDSSSYLNTNVYANDEYSQFMSGPLSFGQNFIVPSYDYGTVFQWGVGQFLLTGVYMNVGKTTTDTINFNFYASQLLYKADTKFGTGNYRFMIDTTDKKFPDVNNRNTTRRTAMFSFDQELGKIWGAWLRFGWQSTNLMTNFSQIYSGGLNIRGHLWRREKDNIGIGIAYLSGNSIENISYAYIIESYYRFEVNNFLALSPDIQYQKIHF
ncbi:carbohydrate porin [Legionella tunisiensis]|uniref:carbohydrate porin n=1 Tax=Legionella tunisiensis TaxID=1034944 RepID=UPI0002FEABDE|nr:carbohydrate porin [Legionella tunisiensis]